MDALTACDQPQAWAVKAAWTLLDAHFQSGHHFLRTWHAWRGDPHRPRMLHYVGLTPTLPAPNCVAATTLPTHLQPLATALATQCAGTGPGFRRILFEGGQVSLTLCVGETKAMLQELSFQADAVIVAVPEDKWVAQLLARRCKRGARLVLTGGLSPNHPESDSIAPLQWLMDAGFTVSDAHQPTSAIFNPHWALPTSRRKPARTWPVPSRCAVVGAGISGASVAYALAVRGWKVTVFDQDSAPARGASSLPAGLAVPHVSADDSPRSRLSRSGSRLLLQHAAQHLACAQDWAPSGVTERKPGNPDMWHPYAAWVKPGALVRAWLTHPNITFVGQAQVAQPVHQCQQWLLRSSNGNALGTFDTVVLANAMDCRSLLKGLETEGLVTADVRDKLDCLQAVHGTMSHGTYADQITDLPTAPINGNGCFIPAVPGPHGLQWCAGSSFETDPLAAADLGSQHAGNLQRLTHLLPGSGAAVAHTLDRGPVALWSATRCVTHDRLPLVGPIDPEAESGLWLCVGMGSRGLSFAPLCAQWLAARLCGEPLPVEASLSRSLDLHRLKRGR